MGAAEFVDDRLKLLLYYANCADERSPYALLIVLAQSRGTFRTFFLPNVSFFTRFQSDERGRI